MGKILIAAVCLAGCHAASTPVLTRVPTYETSTVIPAQADPIDLEALVEQFPRLKGRVFTAPQVGDMFGMTAQDARTTCSSPKA